MPLPIRDAVLESLEMRTHLSATTTAVGFHQLGSISGVVFADHNSNGRQDPAERGVAGRYLYLDVNGNGQRDASEAFVVTDKDGRYRFTGLPAGRYFVRHFVPYQPSSPLYKTTCICTNAVNHRKAVAVSAGETTRYVDFGIRSVPVASAYPHGMLGAAAAAGAGAGAGSVFSSTPIFSSR